MKPQRQTPSHQFLLLAHQPAQPILPGQKRLGANNQTFKKITLIPSVAYDKNNRTATYEAILVPQTIAENTFGIEIRIGEKTYEWTSAEAFTLTGGTNHTLEMTVGNASSANIN